MKKILLLFLIFFISQTSMFAIGEKTSKSVAILSDHILDPPTTYFNYPASSELFANSFANELKLRSKLDVKNPAAVKVALKNSVYTPEIKDFVTQYRINYNIDFEKIRPFAKLLKVDNILIVTTNVDTQTQMLKGTVWNLLNVPGADVVNPVHQIVTNVALLDVNSETVVWQNLYTKNLKAKDNGIIAVNFAPNNAQLKAVQEYSNVLSHQVANSVEDVLCPQFYIDRRGNKNVRNSNSVINKTKFYTKNVYDKYIGIDIEEATDKSQKKVKKQLTEVGTEENLEAENQYIEEINEVDEIKEEYNLSNPTREYFQNDNIQMTPQWTPNAYGNKIEDL